MFETVVEPLRARLRLAVAGDASRAADVAALLTLREEVDRALVEKLAACTAERAWEADGHASAQTWLTSLGPVSARDAATLLASAALCARHDDVDAALASGSISTARVADLAWAARDRGEPFAAHLPGFLEDARTLPPAAFRAELRRWAVLTDATPDPDRRGADGGPVRWLHATTTFAGGVRVDGLLDAHGGSVLLGALARHGRPAAGDTRTASERRADALVEALGGPRPRVALDLVVDAGTLADPAGAKVDGPGNGRRHDLARTGPVPRRLLDTLTCDATVRRLVVDPAGDVLDVGRASKVVPPMLRRALERRDGGCTWPGCDRPPDWCDAHHVRHWARGGETTLENVVLLCRYHHRLTHERDAATSASDARDAGPTGNDASAAPP